MNNEPDTVKVVYEWHVHAATRGAFEHWVRELLAYADRSGRLEGSSVLCSGDDWFVLLRFADRAAFDAFAAAAETRTRFADAMRFAQARNNTQLRTGLETWFTLTGRPTPAQPPPRWKMAVVTWVALLPMVIALGEVLPPLPFPLGPAVGTAIPVVLLTWVVMPRLTQLLAGWLYAPAGEAPAPDVRPPRSDAGRQLAP